MSGLDDADFDIFADNPGAGQAVGAVAGILESFLSQPSTCFRSIFNERVRPGLDDDDDMIAGLVDNPGPGQAGILCEAKPLTPGVDDDMIAGNAAKKQKTSHPSLPSTSTGIHDSDTVHIRHALGLHWDIVLRKDFMAAASCTQVCAMYVTACGRFSSLPSERW